MSIDNTIRKLFVVVAGLGLLLATGIIINLAGKQSTPTIALAPPKLQAEVSRIELSKLGNSISLIREKDETWTAKADFSQAATSQKVKDLLTTIYALQVERKVAVDTSQDKELGLSETDLLHVVLRDNKAAIIADYKFSDRNIDNTNLVRLGDDPAVWQIRGLIAPMLKTQVADWVDKRLFSGVAIDGVQDFSVERHGIPTTRFQRDAAKKAWKGSGNPDADKAGDPEILALLRQVLGLEGDKLQALDSAGYASAFTGMEKVFGISLQAGTPAIVELWRKKSDANGDYLVKPVPERKSLDGKTLLLSIPAFRVGELKVQLAAAPPVPVKNN